MVLLSDSILKEIDGGWADGKRGRAHRGVVTMRAVSPQMRRISWWTVSTLAKQRSSSDLPGRRRWKGLGGSDKGMQEHFLCNAPLLRLSCSRGLCFPICFLVHVQWSRGCCLLLIALGHVRDGAPEDTCHT